MISDFLVVLIVSLVFGNGLLYFTSTKKNSIEAIKEQVLQSNTTEETESIQENSASLPEAYIEDVYSVQSSLRTVNEKISLAHEKIAEMETILVSINSVLSSSPNETKFEEKIRRLEDFKRSTKIELEAIKKLLMQLNEFREIKVKPKTISIKKKEEELNRKIHSLVFNTSKKK